MCHQGKEHVFSLGTNSHQLGNITPCSSTHYYVAHYADCKYEVALITGGHKPVAVNSLIWTKIGMLRPVADANAP